MNFVKYFSVLIIFLFFLTSVSAAPGIPHQFYGTVTVNGSLANGASVIAKVSGVEVGSTISVSGEYGIDSVFFVENPTGDPNADGKTIDFYLNGTKVADYIFKTGELTELNLSLGEAPPVVNPPVNNGGSGGGGGGGGGGGLKATVSNKCINEDVKLEVLLSNKKPATNANVVVFKDKKDLTSGKTDDDGLYFFNLEAIGDYKIEIRKSGYLRKDVSFSLVDCSVEEEPEPTEEDIPLLGTGLTCEEANCNDNNPCTQDSCTEGTCNYIMLDGNPCGANGTCSATGECVLPKPKEKPKLPATTGFFGLDDTGKSVLLGFLFVVGLGMIFLYFQRKKNQA